MIYTQPILNIALWLVFLSGTPDEPIVYRNVVRNAASCTWTVNLTIHAPGITGMARYSEYIPEGAKVQVMEQGKADMRRDKERLKFIWTEYPDTSDLHLSYTLVNCDSHFPSCEGRFDFVREDKLKQAVYLKKENTSESTGRSEVGH